ncbi:MAG: electron transport complex subunit E [Fusobacteriaceae bacterium]|jgi:Na+-translocating ferredoxin:NAD+ oxidoreductase subunit E|nr:electron transport complex subunit E [Fusobacteriaceae bacterium]MBP6467581.1 electron transport complex subunit E [Fusobacteriaceae bacterium]MBP9596594.1 electron transport complex subunit E [Fusobacteriaceae bacterium]MBU9917978.1 electron transport complex subunit E [Fusobacteriaceae bacterium]
MKINFREISRGIFKENPTFVLFLGLCPTLGVTTSAVNGIAMGLATLFVLILSNVIISMIKNLIPSKIRIPAYIMVIATLVTVLELSMKAYFPSLYEVLGIFIPLIVVNCIILGRAESYASKNSILNSMFDGIGNGLGFTLSLTVIGSIREIIGSGKLFGLSMVDKLFDPAMIFILPPGAFITIGVLVAIINKYKQKGSR